MNAIGLRIEFIKQKWPDLLKAARLGQLQMFQLGNINTTPEGFGLLWPALRRPCRLLEPRALQAARTTTGSTRRRAACRRPGARCADAEDGRTRERLRAVELTAFRYENVLVHPWVRLQVQPAPTSFAYLDVDRRRADRTGGERGRRPAVAADAALRSPKPRPTPGGEATAAGAQRRFAGERRKRWGDHALERDSASGDRGAARVRPGGRAGEGGACGTGEDLHVAFPVAETGFDPQATSDLYSDHVQRAIFEPLFGFDYLARPYKRRRAPRPRCPRFGRRRADLDDPRSPRHLLRRRPGVQGQARELTAADFVYAWKRLLDPRCARRTSWYLRRQDGRRRRGDRAARRSGKFDYDAPIEGLRALDRTRSSQARRARLRAVRATCRSRDGGRRARGGRALWRSSTGWDMEHPVGTGAVSAQAVAARAEDRARGNPNFRDERFPQAGDRGPPMLARMQGKRLPQIGRIEISIIEEAQPAPARVQQPRARLRQRARELADPERARRVERLKSYYAEQGVRMRA